MPIVNGIELPEAGVTTQLITDPIGGWVYKVTTVVTVDMIRLENVQQKLQEAQADLVAAQQRVDSTTAELAAVTAVIPKASK